MREIGLLNIANYSDNSCVCLFARVVTLNSAPDVDRVSRETSSFVTVFCDPQ